YEVVVRAAGDTSWAPPVATVLNDASTPVTSGELGRWNTRLVNDGDYQLRVSETDTLGLTGSVTISLVVDNVAPRASQTSPAVVSAVEGGDVYTTHGELHLYFPPHAFAKDSRVVLDRLSADEAPGGLPDGSTSVGVVFGVDWQSALDKTATLDLSLD